MWTIRIVIDPDKCFDKFSFIIIYSQFSTKCRVQESRGTRILPKCLKCYQHQIFTELVVSIFKCFYSLTCSSNKPNLWNYKFFLYFSQINFCDIQNYLFLANFLSTFFKIMKIAIPRFWLNIHTKLNTKVLIS